MQASLQPMLDKLSENLSMSSAERQAIGSLRFHAQVVSKNTDVLRQGDRPVECCIVLKGHLCRTRTVRGGKRQILSFHFRGDMPDLQCLHLLEMDHSLTSMTESLLGFVAHSDILTVTTAFPRVANAFWRHTLIDARIFCEWITNTGARDGYRRIAHLFCEQAARFRALGVKGDFPLFFTQEDLADAAGMTGVHANRILKKLREEDLLIVNAANFQIPDWAALSRAADFDGKYLVLGNPSRHAN